MRHDKTGMPSGTPVLLYYVVSVVEIFLKLQNRAGLGVHIEVILKAALIELDVKNSPAMFVIQFHMLDKVNLAFAESRMRKCFCKRLILGNSARYVLE